MRILVCIECLFIFFVWVSIICLIYVCIECLFIFFCLSLYYMFNLWLKSINVKHLSIARICSCIFVFAWYVCFNRYWVEFLVGVKKFNFTYMCCILIWLFNLKNLPISNNEEKVHSKIASPSCIIQPGLMKIGLPQPKSAS